ncbi:MAG: histidine--tRNA ligase [Candidatus Margulisbacteria bacterium]|nr:histidine--tRNA ligase [Candidatus Margulisiibacteriota bacterium]MBU1021360.1 histidine--tRNA ligase [Candidatus Margulisiibacteriota bacterium]MBU1729151.1 histidine--tRNA ligase [Candidatus Margulisiibacteriota bacterium]MBU1954824.1 histidine--tRNA ligase [Candidatus Margulisiibacteriota bacterium]
MKYQLPRGTKDILPGEVKIWQKIEDVCRKIFEKYGFAEIRTPVFEQTELFARSIGTTTDIVTKEMYTFLDKKGRSLTLRPEETAPVVRAGLQNNLISPDSIAKLYYLGPMFRYERPQAGRQRQFNQAGLEFFGSLDPKVDVEVITVAVELFNALGLEGLEVDLNSVGCKQCQPKYIEALKQTLNKQAKELCEDCKERLKMNPLRVLDCKNKGCQKFITKVPSATETLCPECKVHFEQVCKYLKARGITYNSKVRLVRGLDYYTRTVFEVVSKKLGAQNAVCGGGRYDNLVKDLGGPGIPAIGFAVGMERIVELIKDQVAGQDLKPALEYFIVCMNAEAREVAFGLLTKFRAEGKTAEMDFQNKSFKAQMKAADKSGAKFAVIIGEEELRQKAVTVKDMKSGDQTKAAL